MLLERSADAIKTDKTMNFCEWIHDLMWEYIPVDIYYYIFTKIVCQVSL